MRKFIFALAALPFASGLAFAAEPLSDTQLDRVVAGDTSLIDLSNFGLPPIVCPTCGSGGSSTTGGMSTSGGQQTSTGSTGTSTCPGCTNGQTFSVAPGQQVFPALVQFLAQAGYTSQ